MYEFKLLDQHLRLITLKNIGSEIDQKELEAWIKLTRVLTHEIMNSVAPITSLSSTMKHIVQHGDLEGEKRASLEEGLGAIEARSQGLMNFTEAYRALTRVPLPNIKKVPGQNFFQRISSLFQPTLNGSQITWQMDIPKEQFELLIDPDLMEQVLINLLKNAKEAVNNATGKIHLTFTLSDDKDFSIITVTDNGAGIPEDITEKIFIPFYTTKPEGSGIGLSLTKQIIQSNKGELSFNTSPEGTSFTLKF